MAESVRAADEAADRPHARRAQGALFALAFAGLVGISAGGAWLARSDAANIVDRRMERAATNATDTIEAEIGNVAATLQGAGATVGPDGRPDPMIFDAYATDVLRSGTVDGVVLVERDDQGALRVAAVRSDEPMATDAGSAIGDLPATLEATGGQSTGSGTESSVIVDNDAVIVARPVFDDPTSAAVGYVAGVLPLDVLDAMVGASVADDLDVAVYLGEPEGLPLLGPEFDRRARTENAGATTGARTWTVAVGPRPAADLTVMWLVIGVAFGAFVALVTLTVLTRRHERRLARANALLRREEILNRSVQDMAAQVARCLSAAEVVTALRDRLPAAVGAQSCTIATLAADGTLQVVGLDDEGGNLSAVPVDASSSAVEAVIASRTPTWLASPLEWRGDEVMEQLAGGGNALALLPLADGDTTGVLAVSYPRVHVFRPSEQTLLETIGVLAAHALDRGRRYDVDHQTAVAFQRSALPDALPDVHGLTIAARYRPAAGQAAVGGDWYDVLVLDDHRVVMVVGDVVGHGLEAAAAMGRLRTAFQVVTALSTDLGEILQSMSRQVDSIPNSFCTTVVCAVIDLHDQSVTWCRAGHPPPLLLHGGGAELLDTPCHPPLGVVPDADAHIHRRALSPGDELVLFTDGIVERHGESLDEGFDRLGIVARDLADLPPDEFADALVEALVPVRDQVDDIAVLIVRFDGPDEPIRPDQPLVASAPVDLA